MLDWSTSRGPSRAARLLVLIATVSLWLGCDDPSSSSSSDTASSGDSVATTDGTPSDQVSSGDIGPDASEPPPTGQPFLFGANMGHPVQSWGDDIHADLTAAAGANSLRPKLPENHLDRWGYEIERGDMSHYATLGMRDHIAFVIGPIRAHSTIPAGEPDWKGDYYIPANLYEPIWLADGSVNPDNYWAAYLFQTMSIYKEWVTYWEIWNEPDWVPDWTVTQTWDTEPPLASQLPRFNGSIFDYVRMLRIAWEVKEKAAPETFVALGGIGWANFLDAILRYTDNPDGGASSPEFPYTGERYFEVVSFHHYPHFTPGNSDVAATSFLDHMDRLQGELDEAGASPKGFICTESGASHLSIDGSPSGEDYARNYLMKVIPQAHAKGLIAMHWFILSDGDGGDTTDPFGWMGLYQDLRALGDPSEAVLTTTGVAYGTLAAALDGAVVDQAVEVGDSATWDGVAYLLPDGRRAWVVWAFGASEQASATASITSDLDLDVTSWDGGTTRASSSGGAVELTVGSTPVIAVEAP